MLPISWQISSIRVQITRSTSNKYECRIIFTWLFVQTTWAIDGHGTVIVLYVIIMHRLWLYFESLSRFLSHGITTMHWMESPTCATDDPCGIQCVKEHLIETNIKPLLQIRDHSVTYYTFNRPLCLEQFLFP